MAEVIRINRPFTQEELGQPNTQPVIKINRPFTAEESGETNRGILPSKITQNPDIQLMGNWLKQIPFGRRLSSIASGKSLEDIDKTLEAIPEPQSKTLGMAAGKALPDIAMATPFMRGAGLIPKIPAIAKTAAGLGTYAGIKAKSQNQPVVPAAIGGATSGALFHGLSKVGATALQKLPAGKRIGSALGGYATGKTLNPDEDKEAMFYGAMGGMFPSSKLKTKPRNLAQEAASEYRDILRPTQGEVKNIEIRKGKNIDDYYMLAAEEQLPIKQTPDKKLDTTLARQTLEPKVTQIHDELNSILQSRTNKFNLKTLANNVKLELSKTIKNAKELKDSQSEVDNYINSEIERYGSDKVTPTDFNNIKQGMWSVAYDMMNPTSKTVARKIGFTAKEMIERAYPNNNIKGLNELSGRYQTLINLLENAQGRVIQGGKMGRYFAKTIGAVAGSNIPVVGPLLGQYIGGKTSDIINAPERASRVASKKAQKAGIVGQSFRVLKGAN